MPLPSPTDKQARIIWTSLTALAVAIMLAILAGLLWGFGWLLNLLSPVLAEGYYTVPLESASVRSR